MDTRRLAKLSVPRVRGALARTRLHRLLDERVASAVAWIAAEPGAGKSTLAASWASSRTGKVLWFRADEGDADPAVALGYFHELAGQARSGALPRLTAGGQVRLDTFARRFFRSLFALVPAASALVVDDAHAVRDETFNLLLSAAVREAPSDVAFLILSREDPAGALLEDVAAARIALFDTEALAFTPEESAALLADRMGVQAAHRLHARVHGWAAGLALLGHSSGRLGDASVSSSETLAAFFERHVLAQFDAGELRTLACAALLPEIDHETLRAIDADPAGVDLLERLRKRHAFVTRLDRDVPSWRLHDLLRDVLRERFDMLGDAEWRRRARAAAAEAAARRGHVRAAVELYMRAADAAQALQTAEAAARSLVKQQRLAELDAVAATLGPAIVERSWLIRFAQGESAWQRNDAGVATRHYEVAYRLIDEPAPSSRALRVAASALSAILDGSQDYLGTDEWVTRMRAHLPARGAIDDPDDALRIDGICVRATTLIWGERFGHYHDLVSRMIDALRNGRQRIAPDEAVVASGILLEAAGYLLSDESLYRDAVEATAPWLSRPDLSAVVKAGWLVIYGPLGLHWPTPGVKLPAGDPEGCLGLAIEIARDHGAQSVAFTAASFLFFIAIGRNDRAAAQRRLSTLRDVADPQHVIHTHGVLQAEAAMFALDSEWARARDAVDRALELASRHGFPPSERWNATLLRERIAIASGRPVEAREALLRYGTELPEGMRRDFARILAEMASAADALRRDGAIPRALVETIMRGAREHSWRGFGQLLAPLAARLCADALRFGIEPEFARRVVREKHLSAPTPCEPDWPWPIRVRALGGLRVEVDDAQVALGPRAQRKPLDLLKAMIAHGPAPVDTAIVLDALWRDAEGGAARGSFDMAVMRLRKFLRRDDAVIVDGGRVGLDPGCVWVDAFAFAEGAIDDYAGALFGSASVEPWWAAARERLHQRFLRRSVERGCALERNGEFDAALAIYESGLAQDTLAEELYRGAIRCHLAAGRPAEAMRAFRRCREQLSIVLAVAPSAATSALIAKLSAR